MRNVSPVYYMKIDDLIWSLSDHCKLSIAISVNFLENNHETRSNLQSMPTKFKWKANAISKFQLALCSSEISARVDDFKSTHFLNYSSSIETALAIISNFLSAASLSLKEKDHKNTNEFCLEVFGKLHILMQTAWESDSYFWRYCVFMFSKWLPMEAAILK